ncbi:MAG: diiron oxygenase, partial [Acidimicrobiales bacterium]
KLASENADSVEFVRAVNKYHRMEEARHLSFARAVFGEVWGKAGTFDRFLVRHLAPRIISVMFHDIVHPGVYRVVGLPAFSTWKAANRTPQRRQLRYEATRAVLRVLLDAGAVQKSRIPAGWRRLCGLGAEGGYVDLIEPAGEPAATAC